MDIVGGLNALQQRVAHVGHSGNEQADAMAKAGRHSIAAAATFLPRKAIKNSVLHALYRMW